jgi:hypothetical protein
MNILGKRTSYVDVAGLGSIEVKHLTTKEYHQFQLANQTDKEAGVKYLVQTSLQLDDAAYDDVPMSLMKPIIMAILEVNGLSKEQEEEAVKN